MKRCASLLIMLSASAHAEPTRYLQGDVMAGVATPVAGFNAMFGVEGGYRLSGPLWGHAELALGPAADDEGTGYNSQLRGGVEARACTFLGQACVVAGIDLGAQHGAWTMSPPNGSTDESFTGLVWIPRLLIEVGGTTYRFKLGLETDELLLGPSGYSSHVYFGRGLGNVGGEFVSGLAYQW